MLVGVTGGVESRSLSLVLEIRLCFGSSLEENGIIGRGEHRLSLRENVDRFHEKRIYLLRATLVQIEAVHDHSCGKL